MKTVPAFGYAIACAVVFGAMVCFKPCTAQLTPIKSRVCAFSSALHRSPLDEEALSRTSTFTAFSSMRRRSRCHSPGLRARSAVAIISPTVRSSSRCSPSPWTFIAAPHRARDSAALVIIDYSCDARSRSSCAILVALWCVRQAPLRRHLWLFAERSSFVCLHSARASSSWRLNTSCPALVLPRRAMHLLHQLSAAASAHDDDGEASRAKASRVTKPNLGADLRASFLGEKFFSRRWHRLLPDQLCATPAEDPCKGVNKASFAFFLRLSKNIEDIYNK